MIRLKNIREAQEKLKNIVNKTPLTFAPILSQKTNSKVYIKKENLQLTGSFKIRGAFNKLANLSQNDKQKGVIAASAGNHAQGLAYSANYFNCQATIFMPEATPLTKILGVKSYGAKVVLYGQNYDEAFAKAKEVAKQANLAFIHPFTDDLIIAGQGTVALEILDEIDDFDILIVPIGGGGLISGIAIAAKSIKPSIKIIGVVASGAKAMKDSYEAKKPIDSISVKTIADGIAVRDTSPKMLDLILQNVDDIVEVGDKEIANAILFLLEKHKLVVEGAGAVSVAALLHNKIEVKNLKVCTLVSGGNIDVTMLSIIIEKGLVKSHRKMNLMIKLMDKPGALTTLTNIFTKCLANIVKIDYDRHSVKLDFGEAHIMISLETKGLEHQQTIIEELKNNSYEFQEI